MKKVLFVVLIAFGFSSLSFAQRTGTSVKPIPYFGVFGSLMTNTLQPWQLGVRGGVANASGPLGFRASAGITFGTNGPSYAVQGNAIIGGNSTDPFDVYAGLGYGVRRENGTESRFTHGPNALLGLEYQIASEFSVMAEGQVDYRFNTLPSTTPWRFGASVGLQFYLR